MRYLIVTTAGSVAAAGWLFGLGTAIATFYACGLAVAISSRSRR